MITQSILLVSVLLLMRSKAFYTTDVNDTDTFYMAICLNGRNPTARFEEIGAENVTYCEEAGLINDFPYYIATSPSDEIKIYFEDSLNIDSITDGEGYVIYLEGEIKGYCLDETDPLDCSQKWKIDDGDNFVIDTDMTTSICPDRVIMDECDYIDTDYSTEEPFYYSTEELDGYYSICNNGRESDSRFDEIGDEDVVYCNAGIERNGYPGYVASTPSGYALMYFNYTIDIDGTNIGYGYVIELEGDIRAICLNSTDPVDCSERWRVIDDEDDYVRDTMMTTRDCGIDVFWDECIGFGGMSTTMETSESTTDDMDTSTTALVEDVISSTMEEKDQDKATTQEVDDDQSGTKRCEITMVVLMVMLCCLWNH